MLRLWARWLFTLVAAVLAVGAALPAAARVSGPCSNCHTMHDSQDGTSMAVDASGAPDPVPNAELLRTDCLGCHSAADGSTWKNAVGAPIVFNAAQPTYGADAGDGQKQGLAAGNFWWVNHDSANGHNLFAPDPDLSMAPGTGLGCGSDSCHMNLDRPYQGTGPSGCRGCHMVPDALGDERSTWHHADDTAVVVDSFAQGWYRFLGGHMSWLGVAGIEDPDWEHAPTGTVHNEYLGYPGDHSDYGGFEGLTVTGFCTGCHDEFHVQDTTATGASPWLRHPSDAVLPAGGEYAGYTAYDPLVPVARAELTAVSAVVTPGTDMVMCLSCHRAHGSPYPDMLRFPYSGMVAGGGGAAGTGCFKCHTQKDGS
jgi:hypothetical protein